MAYPQIFQVNFGDTEMPLLHQYIKDNVDHIKLQVRGLREDLLPKWVKIYRGTGQPLAYQGPLESIGLLTQAQDLRALVSVGGGVKFTVSPSIQFRIEVHDYMTPFPLNVITPNAGVKAGGWLQNIVPEVGLSYTF